MSVWTGSSRSSHRAWSILLGEQNIHTSHLWQVHFCKLRNAYGAAYGAAYGSIIYLFF